MRIEFMLIADAVENVNGKLYVLGGCWNEQHAQAYPANLRLGVAVSLLLNESDDGLTPDMTVEIVEIGQSESTLSIRGKTELKVTKNNERALVALNFIIPLKKSGRYEVHLNIGDQTGSVEFESSLSVPQ